MLGDDMSSTLPARAQNFTHNKRPLFKLLASVAAILIMSSGTAWGQASANPSHTLPSMGNAGAMGIGEERDLGDRIARELYRDPSAVDDPILSEYLDAIWQRLLTAARQRGELPRELDARMAWRVVQIRDRAVNAFALPGGYLGIQYGLLAATQDRDELATVMGHELSHVTQRHIARSLDQQAKLSPLMIATMVVGALAATKSPDVGQALIVGGQAAFIQQGLNFSRDMEREADRIGYAVMTQAQFSPDGAVRMFERLQAASRLNDSGAWPYLRTHPLTTERIGDMQSRQALRATATAAPKDDLEHLLMAARARVLAETGVDELRSWAQTHKAAGFDKLSPAKRAGVLYQAAMAQAGLRMWDEARQTAATLAQLVASDAVGTQQAKLLQADVAWRAGDSQAALAFLPPPAPKTVSSRLSVADVLGADAAVRTASIEGRSAQLWRAMALIKIGQPKPASAQLQTWVSSHPDDALAWLTLAQAWEAQGNRLRALRAQAESRIAQADWPGARDRLQAAQEVSHKATRASPGDHIEASIIDTRLQLATEKVKQQAEADAKQR